MAESEPSCSLVASSVNEPLVGTAVESVDRWFLLEVNDVWAPKPLATEALPERARARLQEWLETPRTRLQLIRRPGRSGRRSLFMVVSSDGTAQRVELDSLEDLASLDLESVSSEPVDPLVLVCVHGRRDRCCAQYGSAVYRSLQSRIGDLWQTSHLGGHRFAACVLTLPDGLMYGRVRPEHADDFVSALHSDEVADLELFRGRTEYDRPAQAAEIFLRRETGLRVSRGLQWLATDEEGEGSWLVRFRYGDDQHAIRVRREDMGVTRPASCGGDAEPAFRFVSE
jgi:hypothetical protein